MYYKSVTRSIGGDILSNINWRTGAVTQAHEQHLLTTFQPFVCTFVCVCSGEWNLKLLRTTYTVLDIRTTNLIRMSIETMIVAFLVSWCHCEEKPPIKPSNHIVATFNAEKRSNWFQIEGHLRNFLFLFLTFSLKKDLF